MLTQLEHFFENPICICRLNQSVLVHVSYHNICTSSHYNILFNVVINAAALPFIPQITSTSEPPLATSISPSSPSAPPVTFSSPPHLMANRSHTLPSHQMLATHNTQYHSGYAAIDVYQQPPMWWYSYPLGYHSSDQWTTQRPYHRSQSSPSLQQSRALLDQNSAPFGPSSAFGHRQGSYGSLVTPPLPYNPQFEQGYHSPT